MKKVIPVFIIALFLIAGGAYYIFNLGGNAPEEEIGNIIEEPEVVESIPRMYDVKVDPGGNEFTLEFLIPEGWEVEYDNQASILNLFTLEGGGSARERSQIVLSYFDATQFLTLSTVTIHGVEDVQVGEGNYTARRYDIEKKSGVTAFQGQPLWRSERHIAVDFRGQEGRTRYFSIAKNPKLEEEVFQRVLESIRIVK